MHDGNTPSQNSGIRLALPSCGNTTITDASVMRGAECSQEQQLLCVTTAALCEGKDTRRRGQTNLH